MSQMLEHGGNLRLSMGQLKFPVDWLQGQLTNDRILLTACLAFVVVLVARSVLWRIRRKNLPPGPSWGWPILNDLFTLGPLSFKHLRELARKHGNLMYMHLGSSPCIIVSSAAMAKEVLTNHDLQFAYRPPKLYNQIALNDKDIVTTSYSTSWRHLRMICTTTFFTKKRLMSYADGRRQEIYSLMQLILRKSSSKDCVVNLPFQLRNLNTNIMTRMVFNKRLFGEGDGFNLEEARQYQEVLNLFFGSYGIFVISDYIPFLRFLDHGVKKKMQKTAEMVHKKLDEVIDLEGHKRHRLDSSDKQDPGRVVDFVDLLLTKNAHDGTALDDHTIRAVVLDMLFAGGETQSVILEWAMAYLLQHPDVMRRAQAELDDVVGTERVVQESDLEHLPYLDAVVKEVYRVQPSAPLGINHESNEARRIAGYNLPAKTRLIFNYHAIHRDPAVYERPDEFDPSRFLKPENRNVLRSADSFQLMPFGLGRRVCAGMSLAMINVPHVLAHLLHSFDWRLPDDQNPQELDMSEKFNSVTSSRVHPLLVVAQPRKPAFLY